MGPVRTRQGSFVSDAEETTSPEETIKENS